MVSGVVKSLRLAVLIWPMAMRPTLGATDKSTDPSEQDSADSFASAEASST